MVDETPEVLLAEDESKMNLKTEYDRFIGDHLQQLLVGKDIPEPFLIALLVREDENVKVMSMRLEQAGFDNPSEAMRVLLEGCKRMGVPKVDPDTPIIGMVLVSTGCRLVNNDEAGEAYMLMCKYGFGVWLMDFPGARKTRMAMLSTGTGIGYMATMSEDEQGVQEFDRVQTGPVVYDLDPEEPNADNCLGGRMAEGLNDVARMFREKQDER